MKKLVYRISTQGITCSHQNDGLQDLYDTQFRENLGYKIFSIEHTDKKYLLTLHDDVKFFDNFVQVYLEEFIKIRIY